jgi:hypothetical protein
LVFKRATYEVRSSQAETALSDLKGSEDAKAKVEQVKQNMLHYKQEYKRRWLHKF